jgi:hypothetical protein
MSFSQDMAPWHVPGSDNGEIWEGIPCFGHDLVCAIWNSQLRAL